MLGACLQPKQNFCSTCITALMDVKANGVLESSSMETLATVTSRLLKHHASIILSDYVVTSIHSAFPCATCFSSNFCSTIQYINPVKQSSLQSSAVIRYDPFFVLVCFHVYIKVVGLYLLIVFHESVLMGRK